MDEVLRVLGMLQLLFILVCTAGIVFASKCWCHFMNLVTVNIYQPVLSYGQSWKQSATFWTDPVDQFVLVCVGIVGTDVGKIDGGTLDVGCSPGAD